MNCYVHNIKNARKAVEDAFKSFMVKHFSKGPRLTKVYTIHDYLMVVYCKDFLTPLEKKLVNDEHGRLKGTVLMLPEISHNYLRIILR